MFGLHPRSNARFGDPIAADPRRYERLVRDALASPMPLGSTVLLALRRMARRSDEWRGELLMLLHDPGPRSWKLACDLLECATEAELDAVLPAVHRALDAMWPDALRVLRPAWVRDFARRESPRLVELARAVHEDVAGVPEWFRVVTASRAFEHVTHLRVGRAIRGGVDVWNLVCRARFRSALTHVQLPRFWPRDDNLVRDVLAVLPAVTRLRLPNVLSNGDALAAALPRSVDVLDLHGSGVRNAQLWPVLDAFPNLRGLGLRKCWVNDDALASLGRRQRSLEVLDVSLTMCTAEGVATWLARRRRHGPFRQVRCFQKRNRWLFLGIGDPRVHCVDGVRPWLGIG